MNNSVLTALSDIKKQEANQEPDLDTKWRKTAHCQPFQIKIKIKVLINGSPVDVPSKI
jgi:hypothetical protein